MGDPYRVQLSRKRGWRMPENTVSVARPGRWGNPERVVLDELRYTGDDDEHGEPIMEGPWVCLGRGSQLPSECHVARGFGGWWFPTREQAVAKAISMFRFRLTTNIASCRLPIADELAELRGKNLACWCRLCDAHKDGKPFGVECADCAACHADVLLELANAPTTHGGGKANG